MPSSCAVFLHFVPAPLHVHMTVSGGCTWSRMDTKRGTLGCDYPSWALWGRQGVPGRGDMALGGTLSGSMGQPGVCTQPWGIGVSVWRIK